MTSEKNLTLIEELDSKNEFYSKRIKFNNKMLLFLLLLNFFLLFLFLRELDDPMKYYDDNFKLIQTGYFELINYLKLNYDNFINSKFINETIKQYL